MERINFLKFIKDVEDERNKNSHQYALYKCGCGKEKIIRKKSVESGRTRTCGCRTGSPKREIRKIVEGEFFGDLEIIEQTDRPEHIKNKHVYYKCLCKCGRIRVMASSTIRNLGGNYKCGCGHRVDQLAKERDCFRCKKTKTKDEFPFRGGCDDGTRMGVCADCNKESSKKYYKNNPEKIERYRRSYYKTNQYKFLQIKKGAKTRGFEFKLEIDFFSKMISNPCNYCNGVNDKRGLDRVNTEVGYVESNVVSCCQMCNMMKRKHTKEDFLTKARQIAENHPGEYVEDNQYW